MNLLKIQKNRQTKGELNAQDFMNVKNINDIFLYTKDGYAFSYLSVAPLTRELMTENEQLSKCNMLISYLKSVRKPFKILKLQKPIDVSMNINHLANKKSKEITDIKNRIIDKNIEKLDDIATSNKSVSLLFYICIWEKTVDTDALKSRIYEMKNIFDNAGLKATVIKGNEILTLCNLFTNPAFANISDISFKNESVTIVPLSKEVYDDEETKRNYN
jgi:hypothetical protein